MKKAATIFVLAIFLPSLGLAWLALRSIHDQRFILERQQALLCQNVADSLARGAAGLLLDYQREFALQTEELLAGDVPMELAPSFDASLREVWPPVEVGFAVSMDGVLLCPVSAPDRPETVQFRLDNSLFLCSAEPFEVHGTVARMTPQKAQDKGIAWSAESGASNQAADGRQVARRLATQQGEPGDAPQFSKVTVIEAEFREIIGDATEGIVARFVQNRLNVMLWYRSPRDPRVVFGAQLDLENLAGQLKPLFKTVDAALYDQIAVAFLNEHARPIVLSHDGFEANWRHPFVAAEIGEVLPHWEVAAYLLNPARLSQSAQMLTLSLGSTVVLLLLAIGIGGWLVFAGMKREMVLARQKTDFVSNVSHELKTPLTSIRMFSELLAERSVPPDTQRTYLGIISAETARLTRLINNVLDFSRLERGNPKDRMEPLDLAALVHEMAGTFRPQLEAGGFRVETDLSGVPLPVVGDRDALLQVIVNLISNAEKYSSDRKEIRIEAARRDGNVELEVLDRGPGVPRGCEERIFEQFYRADDSLNSGVQGAGLGLALARRIARAHGGDLFFRPRDGGGSCFVLTLPSGG